jgi:hypothetical protein
MHRGESISAARNRPADISAQDSGLTQRRTPQLVERGDVAIDYVDDRELVPVQFHGRGRAAVLEYGYVEALVGQAADRGGHALVGENASSCYPGKSDFPGDAMQRLPLSVQNAYCDLLDRLQDDVVLEIGGKPVQRTIRGRGY